MKKKLFAIVAVIISAITCLSAYGCNVVTTNGTRDYNRTVATVQINGDFKKEVITKKDMVMSYINYGYQYVQNGYTQSQVFEMILDNLINNRLIVQHAMKEMEAGGIIEDNTATKYTLLRYLDADEKLDAKYETVKSMNDLIDSYEEVDDIKQDTLVDEVRTVPTDATNDDEVTSTEKQDYIDEGIDMGVNATGSITDAKRYKAFSSVLKVLKANEILGENVTTDIAESDYYKDVLESYQESALIEKYEKILSAELRSETTFEILQAKYAEMYADQQNEYADVTAFATALSSASAKSPIFYNGAGGYGYVYNLLLGASTEQTTAISKIKEDDPDISIDDYNAKRKDILSATTVTDLRSTWIKSGYDFNGTYFTGDYTFANDPANSLKFYGTVDTYDKEDPEDDDKYFVKSVREFGLDEFIAEMDSYLGINSGNSTITDNVDSSVYRKADANGVVDEYDAKINELLFAFSTDSGSLNPYKGYVIAPTPDFDEKDQWVLEFAEAGRALLTMGNNSYIIVASDYGYHIMFYSEVVTAGGKATLTDYLNAEYGNKDWANEYANLLANWDEDDVDTEHYLYILADATMNLSTKLNTKETAILNEYKYGDNDCVVKYPKVYKDLLSD